jgi:hypothetical protein
MVQVLLAILLPLLLGAGPDPTVRDVVSRPSDRSIEDVPLFRFRIGFWNNLHGFLYVLGRDRNQAPDRLRVAVAGAPKDVEGLSARPDAERAAWDEAIGFYAGGLSKKDAVFDGDLVAITRALAAASDSSDLSGLGLDATLVAVLQRAAPVYRAVWWPRHSRSDAERRDDLQALVAKHGAPLVKRLTAVYGTTWPAQPRTIDVAAYTNWAGAYSTDGGLIEFASTAPTIGGVDGLETLLHEASHQWDAEVGLRLVAIAARQGKRVPPALSHAIIFYTAGEIVKEAFPDHVPYADKNGIWQRGGNPAIKPLLDRYWLPYLRGQATFDEAIAAIVAGAAGPEGPAYDRLP